MTGRTIMAMIAVVFWASIWLIFWKRDLRRWWANRATRRNRAERLAREQAAARQRMLDDMAEKYGVPKTADSVDRRT